MENIQPSQTPKNPFPYIKDPVSKKNHPLDSKEGIELLLKYLDVNRSLIRND